MLLAFAFGYPAHAEDAAIEAPFSVHSICSGPGRNDLPTKFALIWKGGPSGTQFEFSSLDNRIQAVSLKSADKPLIIRLPTREGDQDRIMVMGRAGSYSLLALYDRHKQDVIGLTVTLGKPDDETSKRVDYVCKSVKDAERAEQDISQ